MGDLLSREATSSQEDIRPTSNSLPKKPGTTAEVSPGRVAGSPEQ